MKAYFYCRVAHDDSFSLEQQVAKLRRYAEQAGYTIVGVAAEHGVARCAFQRGCQGTFRGDVSGSQKQYGFLISAEDPECDTVEIYEAPIDAMSGATLRQYKHDRPWRGVHYLALGGLNHQPIDYFLAHHPAVKTAVLCFDRDEPGRNFAKAVVKKLTEKNLVVVDMPPAVGKDYNEYAVQGQCHCYRVRPEPKGACLPHGHDH